jgi:DNA gyrase subunit A
VILVSSAGQGIRFSEEDVRPMGLPAGGVYGMKLGKKDEIAGAGPIKPRGDVIIITEKGQGKRTSLSDYPTQGRYGQGVIAMALTKESGPVALATTANVSDRLMLLSQKGSSKTIYVKSLSKLSRTQKGKAVMSIRGRNKMAQLIVLPA